MELDAATYGSYMGLTFTFAYQWLLRFIYDVKMKF